MVDTAKAQPVSLRDELANSYDEQEASTETPGAQTPEAEAGAEIEAEAEELAAGAEGDEEQAGEEESQSAQKRDQSGKFVKKAGEAEGKDKTAQPATLDAPSNWIAEDRANYAKLPKEGKEFLLRRHKQMEADYTKKTQELAVQSKDIAATKYFKDSVESLFTPYRNIFATQGMDEIGGVRYLLGWFTSLQQNPEQTIIRLAQDYGVDFTPKPGQQVNPELAPLIGKIQTLETRIAQNDQAQQAQVSGNAKQQVTSFAQETDAEGNPKYPHFETVREDMSVFIGNGRASTLEEAYGMAIRLRPEIYDAQLEESILGKQKTTQQQEIDEAARKAAQAKKAAKGVKSGSTHVEKQQPKTIRDDLSEAYDAQVAR